MGNSKSSSKREVFSNTSFLQEIRQISDKQSNLIPKQIEKKNKQNPKLVEGKKLLRPEQK